MDRKALVPAAVQVLSRDKLLAKILPGIQAPLLVQLSGTCRGIRLAAASLADQRALERIVALIPTWEWVDFSSAPDGPAVPHGPHGPEPLTLSYESTITNRARAVVRAQALRWWVACPFRFHGLGDIARSIQFTKNWDHPWRLRAEAATKLLSRLSGISADYTCIVARLIDTKRPKAQAVESVEKLRELLLDPDNKENIAKYGTVEAYDIRDLKSLTSLAFVRDTDVTLWDTSRVTDMSLMVQNLTVTLRGIEHWNTSRVTSMTSTFAHSAFNQDIGNWDVGRVETMSSMFDKAPFNVDIGRWDTSSVRNMSNMFAGNSAFNQDIGKWDVGQVHIMISMFEGAAAFDRDIGAWAVGSVVFAFSMLNSCPIREAYMPPIGLTVRGPRATELRPELTRITGELGLSTMSVVCVDTSTGPIRVSLNKAMLIQLSSAGSRASFHKAASELRAKAQDTILRYVCGFYAAKGTTVQFNWTAPLNRPRPWTCAPEPLTSPEPRSGRCAVS